MDEPVIVKGGPVRRFADSGVQALIERQIEQLEPGVTGVSIRYQWDGDKHRVAVLGRKGNLGWTIAADKPTRGGKIGVEAEVVFWW